MNKTPLFDNSADLPILFGTPENIYGFLELHKGDEELYWKNKEEIIPGILLCISANNSSPDNYVAISIVSYEGSKDYTGCGYAFAITKHINGTKPIVSYRVSFDGANEMFFHYANELNKLLNFAKYLNAQEPFKSTSASFGLLDGKAVNDGYETAAAWEKFYGYLYPYVQNYFRTQYGENDYPLYKVRQLEPVPNILVNVWTDVVCEDIECEGSENRNVELIIEFEKDNIAIPVNETILNDILLSKMEIMQERNILETTEGIEINPADISEEDLKRLYAVKETFSFEAEWLSCVAPKIPLYVPENLVGCTEFWDSYMEYYALYRTENAPSSAAMKAYYDACSDWKTVFEAAESTAEWHVLKCPYKDESTRFVLDMPDDSFASLNKEEVYILLDMIG